MSGLNEAPQPAAIDATCAFCAVRVHSICAVLAPEQRAELDRMAKRTILAPKESLFSQGQPSLRVFNVTEGVVRLYKLLPDGRRQVVGFRTPGDFIGLSAGDHHALSADAINRVSVCWFQKQAFSRFADDKLALLRKLNEFANREIAQAHERMMLLGRFSAEEKMASFLLGWRERMARLGRRKDEIALPMSRRDIADYLGLTIETVSRTFTRLEREKVFGVVTGGVRVLNEKRAAELAAALPPG
jgi:CRP/FNR family transcriptional regulator